jgi:hypothetical protein
MHGTQQSDGTIQAGNAAIPRQVPPFFARAKDGQSLRLGRSLAHEQKRLAAFTIRDGVTKNQGVDRAAAHGGGQLPDAATDLNAKIAFQHPAAGKLENRIMSIAQ